SGRETAADGVQEMLARDPADGIGQLAESGPMHELGNRRYKRRRLRIAFHDVSRPMIACDGALRRCDDGKHLSGSAGNQSATGLEEGTAALLLPTDRLAPRPVDAGVRRSAGRPLIAHRTPPYCGIGFPPSRLREIATRCANSDGVPTTIVISASTSSPRTLGRVLINRDCSATAA